MCLACFEGGKPYSSHVNAPIAGQNYIGTPKRRNDLLFFIEFIIISLLLQCVKFS